ncbi:MAG: zinc-binding dehydrogenase, partial [Ilumatobacteraceae bacterium]
MRATVMRDWELRVDDVADPVPGPGQVLTKMLACGICGSDLHMLKHGAELRRLAGELEADQPPDPMRPIPFEASADTVMGHEFCCEVVDLGPEATNLTPGQIVVSMPAVFDADGIHAVGYSNRYPGGYAELLVLNELMAIPVPEGVPPSLAALTEPLAVGVHAVNKSRITGRDAAIVLGLGPVGLACVAELKMRGIGPVIGADFSSRRRALAEHLGCDVVVDPRDERVIDAWRRVDGTRPLVIFEAVGVPGMIEQAMRIAPKDARVLVVGVCMQEDTIHPMLGIGRELSIQFALAYEPQEFAAALRAIAEGAIDLAPLITATVGIDGVPAAFDELADPEGQAKIMV